MQRPLDQAVYEVGQAIFGQNTTSKAIARKHMRAALSLLRHALDQLGAGAQAKEDRTAFQGAISALRVGLVELRTDT